MKARYSLLSILFAIEMAMAAEQPVWVPTPPGKLTIEFFRTAEAFEDIDDELWIYLCELVADGEVSHELQVKKKLRTLSPELRRYYLARGFDWEQGYGSRLRL